MMGVFRNIPFISELTLLLLLCLSPATKTLLGAEAAPPSVSDPPRPKILSDIPYTKPTDPKSARRQTLDLYLPARTKSKPPLVVFLEGGFWTLSYEDYRIGPAIADVLLTNNVAVALVRYRLAPKHRHPAQARDVAAAVAHLVREANRYGYDPKKIFIAGHSAGAHLAALIALDPSYLAKHQKHPTMLAGVIAISGLYNLPQQMNSSKEAKRAILQTFGTDTKTAKAASPITYVRTDAPPFLILTASGDFNGFRIDARKFAVALRATGHQKVEQYIIHDRDHFSIAELTGKYNKLRKLLLAFLRVKPLPPYLLEWREIKRNWLNPPFSTVPFWSQEKLIRSYPIDGRFVSTLATIYGPMKYELLEWSLERYYAIDLFSYLDSLPQQQIGRGTYLIMTNIRNEAQFWSLQQIKPYKPVIVVGIDNERNLFRLSVFYRMWHEYSWKAGPQPPVMARPVGAFIHFLKKPPPKLEPQVWHSALTKGSFRLVETNPLAMFGELPKEVNEALTYRNGCLYCHRFRGVGSRSHHNLASTGAPYGGFALPLETYPPDVWKAFMFNQYEVAKKMGASPNIIDENAKQALFKLVVKYREKR
ncbi:MAG: alpha/beta hydrolase [Deltaproteobacteria bacterium]|nr:alpha/beta hydrolase [Deltaproteobacteria bacterium]